MKRSDIEDLHVLRLAREWQNHLPHGLTDEAPGVVSALVTEGIPERLALAKVLHMSERGLLDYGVSPYYAWPTDAGEELLLADD